MSSDHISRDKWLSNIIFDLLVTSINVSLSFLPYFLAVKDIRHLSFAEIRTNRWRGVPLFRPNKNYRDLFSYSRLPGAFSVLGYMRAIRLFRHSRSFPPPPPCLHSALTFRNHIYTITYKRCENKYIGQTGVDHFSEYLRKIKGHFANVFPIIPIPLIIRRLIHCHEFMIFGQFCCTKNAAAMEYVHPAEINSVSNAMDKTCLFRFMILIFWPSSPRLSYYLNGSVYLLYRMQEFYLTKDLTPCGEL